MKLEAINETFHENVESYIQAKIAINQCLAAYEANCKSLIKEISASDFTETVVQFDRLIEIHGEIAKLYFLHKYKLNDKMATFVSKFDRHEDLSSKRYWFEKFKSGDTWWS